MEKPKSRVPKVKVYKRKGSPFFQFSFMWEGKPIRKSSGITDANTAYRTARTLQAQGTLIYLQKHEMDIPVQLQFLQNTAFTNKSIQKPDPPPVVTLGQVITKYVHKVKESNRYSDKYKDNTETWSRMMLEAFGEDLEASKLSTEILDDYVNRASARLSDTTICGYLCFLKRAYSKAIKYKMVSDNPLDDYPIPEATPNKSTVATAEEIVRMLEYLDVSKNTHRIIFLSLVTGMRYEDIVRVDWSHINWRDRILTVEKAHKNNTRIIVPLPFFAANLLKPHAGLSGPIVHTIHSSAIRYTIKKISGKPYGIKIFRNSLFTLYGSKGIDRAYIVKYMGHKGTTTDKYLHFSDEALRDKIDSFWKTVLTAEVSTLLTHCHHQNP